MKNTIKKVISVVLISIIILTAFSAALSALNAVQIGNGEEWKSHAVTMVGWDDNYPKENFPVQPKKNGAILCKNSEAILTAFELRLPSLASSGFL